jgi:hypothetical protein
MNNLMMYLGAKGEFDLWMLLLNGLIAATTSLILVFANPAETMLPWRVARTVLAGAYGLIAARILAGEYWTPVEPTELLGNAVVLCLVWTARGDVRLIVGAVRSLRTSRSSGR